MEQAKQGPTALTSDPGPEPAVPSAAVEPIDTTAAQRAVLRATASDAGLERISVVAWRDLDDPEAGGSELHAHRVVSQWAAAGLGVTMRTSSVPGQPRTITRDGYRVIRKSGRYAVFGDAAWDGLRHGHPAGEGLVEVWNGMPFCSPLWFGGPKVVFLHHVHAEMWRMVLPGWMARVGSAFERRGAPPLYRGTRIVTLSNSSKEEIVDLLRLDPDHISVVPPGVEPQFSPGGQRSATPLVVAVGRLVPVKRFELLVESLVKARTQVPGLRAVIIGEGYERPMLEELRHAMGADDWLDLPGRVTDHELVGWYQKAWVVASSSLREGWGMTLTEAGACGTPAVATDIAGHRDAVVDGQSGLLAGTNDALAASLVRVLSDEELRARLSAGAAARAARLTWDATARATLELLAAEAARQR